MYSAYAEDAYEMAWIAKQVKKDILVVMGGAHASACPETIPKKWVDLIVVGEGEETFLEIVKRYENKQDLNGIPGTFGNPPRQLIDNIDELPFPAFHLLPLERYIEKNKNASFNMRPAMFVVTSRGCPFNCKFCSIKSVWGRTWRYHSPKRVVDEIELLVKSYGVGEIHFIDDNISVDKKRLKKICDEIVKRKLDIKWTTPNGIAIWTLDKEVLKKMKKSGCYRLTFGIETACKDTQRYIRKQQIDLDKAKQIIREANRLGIWTISTFIIGFPDETKEDVQETIGFAINSDIDFAFFFLPMPFPNTDMEEDYKIRGLIDKVTPKELSGRYGVATEHFSANELNDLQKDAYSKLIKSRVLRFLNPLRITGKIKDYEDFNYCCRLTKIGLSQLIKKYVARV